MKKLISLLMLSGMFLFAGSSYANTTVNKLVKSEIVSNDKIVSYTLDLGDVSNVSETEIAETIQKFIETNLMQASQLECSITITVNAEVGVIGGTISVTVTGPCDEIAAKAQKIAKDLVKVIKNTSVLR